MAIPSLIELVIAGTSVAKRYSETLSSFLTSINRFIVKENGNRVDGTRPASLSTDGITFLLRADSKCVTSALP
jgi:hypothetical protein